MYVQHAVFVATFHAGNLLNNLGGAIFTHHMQHKSGSNIYHILQIPVSGKFHFLFMWHTRYFLI